MEQRLHVYGILGWMFQHIKIITWGAEGIFFKYLAKILGIISKANLLSQISYIHKKIVLSQPFQ